jgi:hypothetical protein
MTGLLPGPATTDTLLEAFRPGTEPTNNSGSSSPFVFGGSDYLDPGVLSNFTGVVDGERAQPRPQQQQQEDLGGLY